MVDFSKEELTRYARHLALPQVGLAGQKGLKEAKVLIVGAGGLGSPVALYLAAAGIGQICLVDDDVVSLENLQRQILYKTTDIGRQKVGIAKEELHKLNPHTKIDIYADRFEAQNAIDLVSSYDLVIDGSDNFATRDLVNEACVLAKKPLIFGAIFRFDGQISVFNYNGGPCYACLYPETPKAEDMPNCSEAGVLGVLPGVIGSLMATECLKLILKFENILSSKILVYRALEAEFQTLKVTKRNECKICGIEGIKELTFSKPSDSEIDSQKLKQILADSKSVLIDVRSTEEFDSFHLPDAIHIPLHQIKSSIERLPTNATVIFICQSGVRSTRALEIMKSLGRTNGFQLRGGMNSL